MVTRKRIAVGASVTGGVSLFVIALAIWAAVALYYGKIELGEMPFLTIVARRGNLLRVCTALFYTFLCLRRQFRVGTVFWSGCAVR